MMVRYMHPDMAPEHYKAQTGPNSDQVAPAWVRCAVV